MVLINKHPKLSCHMASMPVNDRRFIKPAMLICFCSAKFLLYCVNIVPFSNNHNIVSSLICGCQNKPPMEFLDLFLRMSKSEYRFQGGTSFVDLLCFCSVVCLLCLCARLFICALWSPAGKGLTSWLSFVVSTVSLSLSHWYPGSGVVLICIDS